MKHITPIIYTTDACNMACKYCYSGSAWRNDLDSERINKNFISRIPLLLDFSNQVISFNNSTNTRFIFHGGEPLLITPESYAGVFEHLREKDFPIDIHIQTNGTKINNNFIALFKKFDVKIGVSLDGPAQLNDMTRVFKNNKGSFSTIFRNIQKMKEANIKFGCLLTLNKTNINNVKAIYSFFKKNNISFNIRPIFETGYSAPKKFLITPREYAVAFCKLFDLWFEDSETEDLLIDEFASIIAQFIKPIEGLVSCAFTRKCSEHFVSYDLEGNLYPCDRLYGIPDFQYGNLQMNSLESILLCPTAKKLSKRWTLLSKTVCRDCDISDYCYGGCPGNGYFYFGSYFEKDYYCEAYRTILRHIYLKTKSSLTSEKIKM